MSIQFRTVRSFATGNSSHIFSNIPVASLSFKVRIDAITGGSSATNALTRTFPFDCQFFGITGAAPNVVLTLEGSGGGAAQATIPLAVGSVYVLCLVWDGNAGVQTCYVSGVPQVMGRIAGNTSNWTGPISLGPLSGSPNVAYTIGDGCGWDNYGLTLADAQYLTNNGDPTTVGTGATSRLRWTMDGTVGSTPAIGDTALKNAYGTGLDFLTAAGSGTAVYAAPLVWSPTVTAHPYVAGCGTMIGCTYTLNTDGSAVIPSRVLTTPTLAVNGTDHGALAIPWGGQSTGVHACSLWSTPGTPPLAISPNDVAVLTAPPSWATTPAGSVGGLSGAIANRSGGSSVQVEGLTKTLAMGYNHPSPGGMEYYPFLNAKYLVGLPGQFGKLPPGNGYQVVNQPCEAGLVLLVWDALKPSTPAILSLSSGAPSFVTVTHLPQYDVSPANGIGYVRVYQVAYVPGSGFDTTQGGSIVTLNYADPAYTGTSNYDDLWIYLAGEWDIVNGVPAFDRSDPLALSRTYLSRVQGAGSMRAVDMTACGGACFGYPRPELLLSSSVEWFWGFSPINLGNVGFTSIGPVDPVATPYVYSPHFRQASNQFTATLADTIGTTPAVGTNETWHFSDGATAPLMAGLEVQVDSEVVRILSGSGTAWVVYRGSNGTTPATHAPGTVTVFGRAPITAKVKADGTAPFTAPAFVQCNAPHGMTTAESYYPVGSFPMTMADGTVEPNLGLSRFYATGPNSFMSIWSGWYVSKPNGTKPGQTYALDPATHYMQRLFFPNMPLAIYCNLVSRLPGAKLHYNIPLDACDDMVYAMLKIVMDNFPAGRTVFLEYANEPWNQSPPFQANLYVGDMYGLAMPPTIGTQGDPLPYYAYRMCQVHAIGRRLFTAAGRASDLVCVANCQMNSGNTQVTPHLNLALSLGQPLDAIAVAPYFSMAVSSNGLAATVAAFDQYTDEQACEQLLHDITYDTTGIVAWLKNVADAVKAYNAANGKDCLFMGYEGSLEYAPPPGAHRHEERNHDIQYNPNYYHVEQAYYALLQAAGLINLHLYGIGIGWPDAWGVYHMRTQKHSRGDGLNGAANNRQISVNPDSPNYIAPGHPLSPDATIKQDINADSVRGQAFLDWNAQVGATPATSYTFTGPSPATGVINTPSGPYTVTPNGKYTGTITVMLAMGGLTGPVVLSWSGTSEGQSFSITPTVAGTITLTPSSSPALTDQPALTYVATAPPPLNPKFILVRKVIPNVTTPTGH